MLERVPVLCGRRFGALICAFVFTMFAAFSLSGCGGSSKSPTVAVTASVATVDGADTATLSATVANDKGTEGVSWSVSGGGTLSNATTTSATYTAPPAAATAQTVTVTATSVADTTMTGSVTLTVAAKPAVTAPNAAQLTGTVGAAYSLQLATTGGIAPYTWTLTSGTLPTNWILTSGGLLSGPALVAGQAGQIDLTFTATDSGKPTAMTAIEPVTVTINPAPAITFTGTMPAGTYNASYTGSAAATGGGGTLSYSLAPNSGPLPNGLTLNASTGAVTGTPAAAGTFPFSIQASDAFNDSATQAYSIGVAPATPTLAFAAISPVTYGVGTFVVSASSASSGSVTYSLTGGQISAGTVSSAGTVTVTGAGTIYLTASQAATANYKVATATTSVTVNKAEATVTVSPYTTVTYDGNPHTATATATGVSGVSLPASDFTLTGTTHTNAGTYSTDAWSFADPSGNYANANGTVADTISKATATVNVTGYSVTYDGNPHTATATATGVGSASLPASDFTLTGTTHTNAVTNSPDAWSFADTNYVSQNGNVSDSIAKATATATVTGYTVTYDGNPHTATATATGVGSASLPASDFTLTGTTHTNAVTNSSDAWSFADQNYVSQSGNVSDTIAKATATVNVTGYTVTYDTTAHTATATATGVGGALPASDFTLTATTHTNAGTYNNEAWSFADLNYLSASGTVNDKINQAAATINITGYTLTYDGNPHTATASATGVNGALPASDFTLAAAHTNAGTYSNEAWSFTDPNGNYANASGTVNDKINEAAATIQVVPYNVISDGNPHTATGSATGVGNLSLPASDFNLSGTTHTNIGSYSGDPWSFSDPSGNYAPASGTITDTINATLAIQTTTLSPTYVYAGTSGYSQTLTATGGASPYTWSVTLGGISLGNAGLGLGSSTSLTNTVFGNVPTNAPTGPFTFTVQVTDHNGVTASQMYSLTVYGALTMNSSGLPSVGTTGVSYSGVITPSGGSGAYSWTVNFLNGLTDNLFLGNNGSLTISGTPQTVMMNPPVTFSVKLTDTLTGVNITQNGFTISVNESSPVTLPPNNPNPSSLPSATENQSYTGQINAVGGTGPYSWTINGTTVTGAGIPLSNSMTASNSGGSTLTIGGTPSGSASVPLTNVVVTDSLGSTATNSYNIAVNNPGYQVSGQVMLNGCGGNSSTPTITVNLYAGLNTTTGTPVQTTTTSGSGSFNFSAISNGPYTIVPSISGPSAMFYPTSQSVTVGNSDASGTNFGVALGYTVSGNVIYGGSRTGQVYLALTGGNCNNGGGLGASVYVSAPTAGQSYTIRGVPPGSYTLLATMDDLGYGMLNTDNPTFTGSTPVTVVSSNASQDATLVDPTATAPSTGPTIDGIMPNNDGFVIAYEPITSKININNNQVDVEAVTSYTVEWNGSATFSAPTSSNSHTFKATGGNSNVWILTNALVGSNTFVSPTPYYFRVRATNSAGTHSPWTVYSDSGTPASVSIPTSVPPGYYAVSGSVAIPSGVTPTGPLYVGLYGNNAIYSTVIQLTGISTSSANNFTVYAPDGNGYFLFAILDQAKDGMIDSENISNTDDKNDPPVNVSGGALINQDPSLPTTNVKALVTTQYQYNANDQNGAPNTSSDYNLNFELEAENKLPVSVTLTSGPNVIYPVDINNLCENCGHAQFQYNMNIDGDLPSTSDVYTFNVVYSDGTTDSAVTAPVSGVLTGSQLAASQMPTGTSGVSTTPDFTWSYPANASNYTYQFNLSSSNNSPIWQIPSNNSKSNGFTSSQIAGASIPWSTTSDPTGASNPPTLTSLPSDTYHWTLETIDSNGNSAWTQMYFIVP